MILKVTLTGLPQAVQRLADAPTRILQSVEREMLRFVITVQRYVVLQKLQGQVLHHRSGNLGRAIVYSVDVSGGNVTGVVGVAKQAPYGKTHELGGTVDVREHMRESSLGRSFRVQAHKATYPKRAFLRPSVDELLPAEIAQLQQAVNAVL